MQIEVPEAAVNDLFRANLLACLAAAAATRRRRPGVQIDLPYSNFAYDQEGTPWPVNQAVYVDYMLYDLRGYHDLAEEELLAMFRNNQEPNGHVKGYANWGVYTPGMLYAVAQHYRLSGDRRSLDRLLPPTLKSLDWCLAEMHQAARPGRAGRRTDPYAAQRRHRRRHLGLQPGALLCRRRAARGSLAGSRASARASVPGRGPPLPPRHRAAVSPPPACARRWWSSRPHLVSLCALRSALLRAALRPVVSHRCRYGAPCTCCG